MRERGGAIQPSALIIKWPVWRHILYVSMIVTGTSEVIYTYIIVVQAPPHDSAEFALVSKLQCHHRATASVGTYESLTMAL